MTDDDAVVQQDAEHLRVLSIFHYVVAGMVGLFALLPFFHFVFGAVAFFGPGLFGRGSERLPAVLTGAFLMLFAGVWMCVGWTLAAFVAVTGKNLDRRRHYMFCLVMACVEAATCMPFGTILGVFTIIVLLRPSVKTVFDGGHTAGGAAS